MDGEPIQFISDSDYATLKNDSNTVEIILNIPGGVSIPASTFSALYSKTEIVGVSGAPMQIMLSTDMYPTRQMPVQTLSIIERDNVSPNTPSGYAWVSRSSATEATLYCQLFNSSPSSTTTVARKITAYVRTFIPPFA